VRSSHGSSIDVLDPSIIPGGSDVQAGGPDINWGTKVGERGLCVVDRRSGDGDRLLRAGRREVARVSVVVPGGYDDGNTAVVKLGLLVSGVAVTFHSLGTYHFNSLVHGDRSTATQTHRSNGGPPCPPCFFGDPEHTGDTGVR